MAHLAAPAFVVEGRDLFDRCGVRVEQGGGQAEQFAVLGAVLVSGGHGVLDDPHRDRITVPLARWLEPGQVAAIGQPPDDRQGERVTDPPQQVRAGRRRVAPQPPGQKLPVGHHQHPRTQRAQQPPSQDGFGGAVAVEGRPQQRLAAALGVHQQSYLRERAGPGLIGRPVEGGPVVLAVRHVHRGPVHHGQAQPTPETPRQVRAAGRAGHPGEQQPQRLDAQPGPRLGDRPRPGHIRLIRPIPVVGPGPTEPVDKLT